MGQIMLAVDWVKKQSLSRLLVILILPVIGCSGPQKDLSQGMNQKENLVFMSLDPGHFHAGLIHQSMYPGVDSTVYVYAPEGQEVVAFMQQLSAFNSMEKPTSWQVALYKGADFLEKMIAEKPGNVLMVAGKNDQKIDYILAAIQEGIHVYADKPLVIDREGFQKLEQAVSLAKSQDLMLYDIMTERFEITSILQKELSKIPAVFGALQAGSIEEPAITKESVHHFYKQVSGKPLIRPDWFFDVGKQGEGLVDVTTHLVDLIQWASFPEEILNYSDVTLLSSKRWATPLSAFQFQQVTGKAAFSDFLKKDVQDGQLQVFGNGSFVYKLKGIHAKVSVTWNFEAPEGGGDTHYSIMRGTKAHLIIRQGEAEGFRPTLYVDLLEGQQEELEVAIQEKLQRDFPGLGLRKLASGEYLVEIPDRYHVGHEAHFAQVTETFLDYYQKGKLPDWETPNLLVKYHTTTGALELARQNTN